MQEWRNGTDVAQQRNLRQSRSPQLQATAGTEMQQMQVAQWWQQVVQRREVMQQQQQSKRLEEAYALPPQQLTANAGCFSTGAYEIRTAAPLGIANSGRAAGVVPPAGGVHARQDVLLNQSVPSRAPHPGNGDVAFLDWSALNSFHEVGKNKNVQTQK